MRLLLTSDGVKTDAIARELERLLEGRQNRKVAVIPTAAHAEPGDKSWLLDQITSLRDFGYGRDYMDIVNIGSPDIDWSTRLEQVGIVFVTGGHAGYLLWQLRNYGCDDFLHRLIVRGSIPYIGASAGSTAVGPSIAAAQELYGEDLPRRAGSSRGLCWTDLEILPHVGSELSLEAAQAYVSRQDGNVTLLRDNEAVSIGDDYKIRHITG